MVDRTDWLYDVFISYSHADAGWVRGELVPRLEQAGVRVCIDYRDFSIGMPSADNMARAADNSRYALIVLTPAWIQGEWTQHEGLLLLGSDPAGRLGKVLPLLLVPCEPPPHIKILSYTDFTHPAQRELEFARLIRQIRGAAAEPKSPEDVYYSYLRSRFTLEEVAISDIGQTLCHVAREKPWWNGHVWWMFAAFNSLTLAQMESFVKGCWEYVRANTSAIGGWKVFVLPVLIVNGLAAYPEKEIRAITSHTDIAFVRGIEMYPIIYDLRTNSVHYHRGFSGLNVALGGVLATIGEKFVRDRLVLQAVRR
jgi:TIR domain-containing protein